MHVNIHFKLFITSCLKKMDYFYVPVGSPAIAKTGGGFGSQKQEAAREGEKRYHWRGRLLPTDRQHLTELKPESFGDPHTWILLDITHITFGFSFIGKKSACFWLS